MAKYSTKREHQMERWFIFYVDMHCTYSNNTNIHQQANTRELYSIFWQFSSLVLHLLPLFCPSTTGAASPLPSGQEALSSGGLAALPDGLKGWRLLPRREQNLSYNLLNAHRCHMVLGETGAYFRAVVTSDQSSKVLWMFVQKLRNWGLWVL